MKRKLSLLLAMVLAMTMVMGISVTAFAQTILDEDASTHDYDSGIITITDDDSSGYFEVRVSEEADLTAYIYLNDEYADETTFPHTRGCYSGITLTALDGLATVFGPMKPVVRYKWKAAEKALYCYLYTEEYYEAHYENKEAPASSSAHVHNYKWQTIKAPSIEADGLEGEMCSCGATRNTQPLSAYVYAMNEYAAPMIKAAKPGQTITFNFGEMNSFPKSFMEKLVEKNGQNVSFVFNYKWNHVKQEITIPAGTPIDLNFDWYGPAKMAELYGAN